MKTSVFEFLLLCIIVILVSCGPALTDSFASSSKQSSTVNDTRSPTLAVSTRLPTNVPTVPAQSPALAKELAIDFENCVPQRRRIDTAFGSTTFELVGTPSDRCELRYGGEIENPNWDGTLDTICQIPRTLGEQVLKITDYGIDFSPLASYCIKRPK